MYLIQIYNLFIIKCFFFNKIHYFEVNQVTKKLPGNNDVCFAGVFAMLAGIEAESSQFGNDISTLICSSLGHHVAPFFL